MSKKFFFFDVETNGKIKDMRASVEDVDMYPRVTQLAFLLTDENGVPMQTFSQLIKPDGWTVPTEKFFIDNNMSTERCEAHGIPMQHALDQFIQARLMADYSIAHNMTFDSRIMRAEMIRSHRAGTGQVVDFFSAKICTMNASTKYCALPNANGRAGNKWPKLEELHQKLFECKFEGAHDAESDIGATAKCFFELVRRGVITLE